MSISYKILLLSLICTHAFCQDIRLDKLSDCVGLAAIRMRLDSPIGRNCRSPRDPIETRLMSMLATSDQNKACLLITPPTDKLNGYSCIDLQINSDRELSCFHIADSSVLSRYVTDYDSRYSTSVKAYLKAASQCPIGSGDASEAPPSTFPSVFKAFAGTSLKTGFGFTLIIGKRADHNALAYHGYAKLDPVLARNPYGAVEVFDMFKLNQSSGSTYEEAESGHSGAKIVDSTDVVRQAETLLSRRFGLPVTAKVRILELTYGGTRDIKLATRKDDLKTWQLGIESILKRHGYRELTRAEINEMHLDPKQLGNTLRGLLPYGNREAAKRMISPNVIFLLNDETDSCTQIAEVFAVEPVEDVEEDYGQLATVLLGAGDCRRQKRPSGSLSDDILGKVTEYISEEIIKK